MTTKPASFLRSAVAALALFGAVSEPASVLCAQSTEAPARPRVLVFVEGGPDAATIWRGWPVLIQVSTLQGAAPESVSISGPAAVTPERAGTLWTLAPEITRSLALGTYVIAAGEGRAEVVVVDPPPAISAEQASMRRRISFQLALAAGDLAAARAEADRWIAEVPAAFEAHSALGDVLRATGDTGGAAVAYRNALARVPPRAHPPLRLHRRYTEVLREAAVAPPKLGAVPPAASSTAAATRAPAATATAAAAPPPAEPAKASASSLPAAVGASSGTAARPVTSAVAVAPLPAPSPADATATTPLGRLIPATELNDAQVRADPAGQWAADARAGSQYGNSQYSARQATGAPNVRVAGNSPDAWCPARQRGGLDWLEVTFANPVRATELRVRQNDAPGAIIKVEAFAPDGTAHTWWEGVDGYRPEIRTFVWFAVRVPPTPYLVARVKLTLNLDAGPGYKEIDAVQLVAATQP